MRSSLLCALFVFITCHLMAQKEIAWLKNNIIPLNPDSTKSPASKYSALKKYIGNAQMVLLGEETHGDGTAFKTKVELVQFLHEEMGFEVLAWEGSLFQAEKAWELATMFPDNKITYFQHCTFPHWSWSAEVQPLFSYMIRSFNTGTPLKITGFDFQPGSRFDVNFFARDLMQYLIKQNIPFRNQAEQNGFFNFYGAINTGIKDRQDRAPGKQDQILDSLKEEYHLFTRALNEKITQLSAAEDPKGKMFCQHLKSIRGYLPYFLEKLGFGKSSAFNASRVRDSLMAENIIWLSQKMYAGKKIIVWAANYHIARNAESVNTAQSSLVMGDYLMKTFAEKMYSIGFTAYEGQWGSIFMAKELPLPAATSFENLFYQTGVTDLFMDFKTLGKTKTGQWLNEIREMRPFGYEQQRKSWPKVFDAVLFNKIMTAAHRIGASK